MKGAQCSGTACPARPRSSGCPHMTSAWFLSLPNGRSTHKCRVACHILSLDPPNRAISLYSRHPEGIEKSEQGEQSAWRQERHHGLLFVSPPLNPVISTTSSCLRQSRRKNPLWVEMIRPKLSNGVAALPAITVNIYDFYVAVQDNKSIHPFLRCQSGLSPTWWSSYSCLSYTIPTRYGCLRLCYRNLPAPICNMYKPLHSQPT